MQRCPTCEFVYEEDQLRCDMDGSQLVHDPHELPQNLPAVRPKRRGRFVPRLIGIVAIPNVLLAALLFYGTTQQEAQTATSIAVPAVSAEQSLPSSETQATEPAPASLDDPSASQATNPLGDQPANRAESRTGPTDRPSPAIVGTKPSPGEGVEPSQPAPVRGEITPGKLGAAKPRTVTPREGTERNAQPKKDSKVGSLIKKTTRFLKKPFKF